MTNYQQFQDVLYRIPPVQAFVVFCLSLPLMLLMGIDATAMLVATGFAFASPLVGMRHQHFWLYQFGSLASQLVLLTAYLAIQLIAGEGGGDREAVFLLPMLVSFAMFPLMCIIGLCRPPSPPPIPPPSDNEPGL